MEVESRLVWNLGFRLNGFYRCPSVVLGYNGAVLLWEPKLGAEKIMVLSNLVMGFRISVSSGAVGFRARPQGL